MSDSLSEKHGHGDGIYVANSELLGMIVSVSYDGRFFSSFYIEVPGMWIMFSGAITDDKTCTYETSMVLVFCVCCFFNTFIVENVSKETFFFIMNNL